MAAECADANHDGVVADSSIRLEASDLQAESEALASGLRFMDRTTTLSDLVSAKTLRDHPVHRWYYYKEGFSPKLPAYLVKALGTGTTQTVSDTFAGVGTTALSLSTHPDVRRIVSVEYSPFAAFVAAAKLNAFRYNQYQLLTHMERILSATPPDSYKVPDLAAFHNSAIFPPEICTELLQIRDTVTADPKLSELDRMFFLVGIAAITEDVSGAMKDGRALRILRGRQRRQQGLSPKVDAAQGKEVKTRIRNQWLAMLEDLEAECGTRLASIVNVQGDARTLKALEGPDGAKLVQEESIGTFIYSPPYLNCLDYTEVYKLELWLLGLVTDHDQFRALREGTLRSHPSIEFPDRPTRARPSAEVFTLVDKVTKFLIANAARASIGKIHGAYFSDMHEALHEQFRALEPGGAIACVVANSTFARRMKHNGEVREMWRLPVLTDVVIARIAEAIGFEDVQIWIARMLQAKNVNGGFAREAVVVARKPLA